ncbi:hypothetical protein Rsub_08927 [Raphidocelis subcapitata]|uniref:Prolyl 4-hydroxylase alpha subunit domain-containing protein n=1 Tax=Raphidocelis subcapitata TaxID=307507 RepID=A0A2V0P9D1_9CHLO|nr:hypothetical protein Rsub_08927 [Raphidocelis subcapitata]|eukprot:GBF96179.1 hypothetical protein Rsub_08927 [Raphidocelis subcapitata]
MGSALSAATDSPSRRKPAGGLAAGGARQKQEAATKGAFSAGSAGSLPSLMTSDDSGDWDGGGSGGGGSSSSAAAAAAAAADEVVSRVAACHPGAIAVLRSPGGQQPGQDVVCSSRFWELDLSALPALPAAHLGAAAPLGGPCAVASPVFEFCAATAEGATVPVAWRLVLEVDPRVSAPAAPPPAGDGAAAAAAAPGAGPGGGAGPCLTASLLLERVPAGAGGPAGAKPARGGAGDAEAEVAAQLMVGVRLPWERDRVRLAVVDRVFPPPPPAAAAGAPPSRCALGDLQLPLGALLDARAASEARARGGPGAAARGGAEPAGGGGRSGPGGFGLLAGITAARAAEEAGRVGGAASAGAGAAAAAGLQQGLLPAAAAAAFPAGAAPGSGEQNGGGSAGAGAGGGLTVCVTFHMLDLVPAGAASGASAARRATAAASDARAPASAALSPPGASCAAAAAPGPLRPQPHPRAVSAASAARGAAPAGPHLVVHHLSSRPRLLVIDGFWGADMCDELMASAAPRLTRSRVASGNETPSRTSWSFFFTRAAAEAPLIKAAEASIEALFAEAAHYDNRSGVPLTRAATIIVYLQDTPAGGATSFPRAALSGAYARPAGGGAPRLALPEGVEALGAGRGGDGVRVFPRRGRAVVFWSRRADGDEDAASIHAAEVVGRGDKWIATRWMKAAD